MDTKESKVLELWDQMLESASASLAHTIDGRIQPMLKVKGVTKEQINQLVHNIPLKIAVKAMDHLKKKYDKKVIE